MGLSLFLAKLIGLYVLIISLLMIGRKKEFETAIRAMLASEGLLAFSGVMNIILGLAIAIGHPIWEFSWRGLITLVGYLSLFKGCMRLAFPVQSEVLVNKMLKENRGYWGMVVLCFILGIYLTYHGFVHF